MPAKAEYRPLTREAAAQLTRELGIVEHADVLFNVISRATATYKRFRSQADRHQTQDALSKLAKVLQEATQIIRKFQTTLHQPLYGTLLRRLGERLTYEAIEQLSGKYVPRALIVTDELDVADFDEQTRLDRSVAVAEAGPKIFVSLLGELQSKVEESLDSVAPLRRGRPAKHLFREFLIGELAQLYQWLFDLRPTSTAQGKFTKFCVAVLQEMQFDLTGIEDAIAVTLKRLGYIRS